MLLPAQLQGPKQQQQSHQKTHLKITDTLNPIFLSSLGNCMPRRMAAVKSCKSVKDHHVQGPAEEIRRFLFLPRATPDAELIETVPEDSAGV